jgi:hypothetical protein
MIAASLKHNPLILPRFRNKDLRKTNDNLIIPPTIIITLFDDKWEQDHPNDGLAGFEFLVRRRFAGSLVHQAGVEVDFSRQVAVGVVLGLQRREHHVFCALGAHFDGEAYGGPHDVAEGVERLGLEFSWQWEEFGKGAVDLLHDGFGVVVALGLEYGPLGEQAEGFCSPVVHGAWGTDFREVFLELLEFLPLFAVHAEEVACEDIFPDHGHDDGHEDIAAFLAFREVHVYSIRAGEDGIFDAI